MTAPTYGRRRALALAGAACVAYPRGLGAAPPATEQRLQNRLELWANFSRKTETLVAQVHIRRESALLQQPLATSATLHFKAPGSMLLRDQTSRGSTTLVEGTRIDIIPNATDRPKGAPIDTTEDSAAAWLRVHLLGLFAPPGDELGFPGARVTVPPGRGYRIELAPPRGSLARKLVRTITAQLDPAQGAVTQIAIAEAQGDRLVLDLYDQRQNLDPEGVDAAFKAADR